MSEQFLDFIKRFQLDLGTGGKTIKEALSWLEQSSILQQHSLDEIQAYLEKVELFAYEDQEEYLLILSIYQRLFQRFPLDLPLRRKYYRHWEAFINAFGTQFTQQAWQDAYYIVTHQVAFLELYSDGYASIEGQVSLLLLRLSTSPNEHANGAIADLEALKALYQRSLSDTEALDLASQLILGRRS